TNDSAARDCQNAAIGDIGDHGELNWFAVLGSLGADTLAGPQLQQSSLGNGHRSVRGLISRLRGLVVALLLTLLRMWIGRRRILALLRGILTLVGILPLLRRILALIRILTLLRSLLRVTLGRRH